MAKSTVTKYVCDNPDCEIVKYIPLGQDRSLCPPDWVTAGGRLYCCVKCGYVSTWVLTANQI
jgi:hypothetical protein